jgi:hypothetical protein
VRALLCALIGCVLTTAAPAASDPFLYACEIVVENNRMETHIATIDEAKHTFFWRGKTYRIAMKPECGRYGWHVTGNGASFDFCTATKGVGSFENQPASVAEAPTDNGVVCSMFVKD